MSTDKTENNVIEDLEPGAAHGDAVRGGMDDVAAKKEKMAQKPTK